MRKLVFLLLTIPFIGQSQNGFKVVEQTATYVVLEYKLSDYELLKQTNSSGTHHVIKAAHTVPLLLKGDPDLRKSSVALNIPANGNPSVEVLDQVYRTENNINILPSKGSLKRNVDPSKVPYVYDESYIQNDFFPYTRASLADPFILRNERGVVVTVKPFAYNPQTNELRVYLYIKVKVNFNANKKGLNELTAKTSKAGTKDELDLYNNKFINYDQTAYVPIAEQGSMLVICGDNFMNTITPFVAWKNQKGIKTVMVPISTVGNDQASIYNFIQSYYSASPDLLYLLFVGDHAEVNSADAGMAGSEIKWSDTYYTFLNGGDHYPELFVGRFSGSTPGDIQTMIDRTFEYEQSPIPGSWVTTAIGIGSDEGDGFGDDGEADWQHERNMGAKLTAWGYTTFHEFYDGSHGGNDAPGDPNPTMVSNAVNAGASLFMYTGHGWDGGCVTSNYTSTEVQAATNNGKYPFVISVACNNGTFTQGSCFAEEFMLARNSFGPTGAIACSGSSILMAWAEPMAVQDEIVEILTDQYANNKKTTLGGLFYNGGLRMLDDYGNTTAEEVMETWVMFGDPSCVLRSKVPTQISATHNGCYVVSDNTIAINCPDEGATVAVSMNDTLLGTAYVVGGVANVPYTITNYGTLKLTISAYNKIPLQEDLSNCLVGLSDVSNSTAISVFPNPTNDVIEIRSNKVNYSVQLIDALGRIILSHLVSENNTRLDVSQVAQGIYTISISSEGEVYTKRIVIE